MKNENRNVRFFFNGEDGIQIKNDDAVKKQVNQVKQKVDLLYKNHENLLSALEELKTNNDSEFSLTNNKIETLNNLLDEVNTEINSIKEKIDTILANEEESLQNQKFIYIYLQESLPRISLKLNMSNKALIEINDLLSTQNYLLNELIEQQRRGNEYLKKILIKNTNIFTRIFKFIFRKEY